MPVFQANMAMIAHPKSVPKVHFPRPVTNEENAALFLPRENRDFGLRAYRAQPPEQESMQSMLPA